MRSVYALSTSEMEAAIVPIFSSRPCKSPTERQHGFPVGADQRIGIFTVLLHAGPCWQSSGSRSHIELTGDYLLPAHGRYSRRPIPPAATLLTWPGRPGAPRHWPLHAFDLSPDLSMNPHLNYSIFLNADRASAVLREIPGVVGLHRNSDSAIGRYTRTSRGIPLRIGACPTTFSSST